MRLRPGTWIGFDGPGALLWDPLEHWTDTTPFAPRPEDVRACADEPFSPRVLALRGQGRSAVTVGDALVANLATAEEAQTAMDRVYGETRPDVLLVWPSADGSHAPGLRELARSVEDVVLVPEGGRTLDKLYSWEAMARRGLYHWDECGCFR